MADLPTGVSFVNLEANSDVRGCLVAFDDATNSPFEMRRFFFMQMPQPNIVRAEHSCSAEQLIVAVNGEASIEVDDGTVRAEVELSSQAQALRIAPGTWLKIVSKAQNTVLLVAASKTFAETRYLQHAATEADFQ